MLKQQHIKIPKFLANSKYPKWFQIFAANRHNKAITIRGSKQHNFERIFQPRQYNKFRPIFGIIIRRNEGEVSNGIQENVKTKRNAIKNQSCQSKQPARSPGDEHLDNINPFESKQAYVYHQQRLLAWHKNPNVKSNLTIAWFFR
jgi:hypothetical protein